VCPAAFEIVDKLKKKLNLNKPDKSGNKY